MTGLQGLSELCDGLGNVVTNEAVLLEAARIVRELTGNPFASESTALLALVSRDS